MRSVGPSGIGPYGIRFGINHKHRKGRKGAIFILCGTLILFSLLLYKGTSGAGEDSKDAVQRAEGQEGLPGEQNTARSANDSAEWKGDQAVRQGKAGDMDSRSGDSGNRSSGDRNADDMSLKIAGGGEMGEWMLTLVNDGNPLPDGYEVPLKKLDNGLQFDARAIESLNAMLSDARAQGLSPIVCSAYRTIEYQQKLFGKQIDKQMSRGFDRRRAEVEARKVVTIPGTSEHNLGLAADIVSETYQILDDKQADTPEMQWLMEHCDEYGFILRYPDGKTPQTGVIYEPWHFRYVGKKAAREIKEKGLCLEEYLGDAN
ncbi:M15 family metallopeptidase [Eubacteriales bacterium mix99]